MDVEEIRSALDREAGAQLLFARRAMNYVEFLANRGDPLAGVLLEEWSVLLDRECCVKIEASEWLHEMRDAGLDGG